MQLTVAEMSRSLLRWDQIGGFLNTLFYAELDWYAVSRSDRCQKSQVIFSVEGSAHRLLRVRGIRAALSFALARRARLAVIALGGANS